jgi:hypothetical protein
MNQLALVHMIVGFTAILLAASSGVFLATELSDAFAHGHTVLGTWTHTLQTSAHAHTTQFGTLHILFGLTAPWNHLSHRVQRLQAFALGCGTFAMSVLMLARSFIDPTISWDILGVVTGICLSAALAAIATQVFGLSLKLGTPHNDGFLPHP